MKVKRVIPVKRGDGRAGGGVRKTEVQEKINRTKNRTIKRNVNYSEKVGA